MEPTSILSMLSVTHTHQFNGTDSGTTLVSQCQKGKTNLDFTEASDSEWQWHQLGHMQVCTSLQTDKHASTPPLIFLRAGCPSCHPTNSVKALKEVNAKCKMPHYVKTRRHLQNWNCITHCSNTKLTDTFINKILQISIM